jgi:hypothetical protein
LAWASVIQIEVLVLYGPPAMSQVLWRNFFEKVSIPDGDGCWEWLASKTNGGYGVIRELSPGPRLLLRAHRLSYEFFNGPIPAGMVVCHRCDNTGCVNPAHLFIGTMADNSADMMHKGRHRSTPSHGEDHGCAKLTNQDVMNIRANTKARRDTLAAEYGVDVTTIWKIRTGRSWQHLT